jgi:hypothetical protein
VIYLNDVLDNFKEYATLYGHEELATERVILMYRDIVQYSRTYGIDISLNNLKRSLQATINLLGQEALTKSILGLKQDSVKRNKSRFNS